MARSTATAKSRRGPGRPNAGLHFLGGRDDDVGCETGTTVSPDYTAHTSRFNGKINWVQIDLGEDAEDADHYIDPEERFRIAMARQ
jgi:arylsulfatase